MKTNQPTVFVVDDDPSVLKALARLLLSAGLNAVTFTSPNEFLENYDPHAAGCVVLDVSMPGLDGLQLQQALAALGDAAPVVFLTGHGDIPTSVKAMKEGAVDFLTKPVHEQDLIAAVHAAIEKDRLNRQARAELTGFLAGLATLTPREKEVLAHVVTGKLNKQIAADLGTVEKTIKVHRAHIMEKLHIRSLADLVRLTERSGIKFMPIEKSVKAERQR
ncbi:response regulator transcription factor [Methylomicrobium sp. RS1]|jgi:FixJ family two-component response regulator|uniref:response regulator transcription factor n=1 Tax=Candidatus Methylomicrobium oryzae TaxID=2802053 RepID=UPI0019249329|nr:response regulator [Methylomicrobium sp. RS1]MBL1265231.1 response regulator transcription factor [Methylomicrobium sp. RS1]